VRKIYRAGRRYGRRSGIHAHPNVHYRIHTFCRFYVACVFVILVTKRRNFMTVSTENAVVIGLSHCLIKDLSGHCVERKRRLHGLTSFVRFFWGFQKLNLYTLYPYCLFSIFIKVNACLWCLVLQHCQIKSNEMKYLLVESNCTEGHVSRFVRRFIAFMHLLTYSTEQSPSLESNRFSASHDIFRILWNPNVHYRIHKCPPPVPV